MEKTYKKEKEIKISRNELCPCNSGKIHKECCLQKKHKYFTLGKNYEGKEIIFNNTKNMDIYDNIADYGLSNIFCLDDNEFLNLSNGLRVVKDIYTMADKGIEQFSSYAPCSKGCSHCCSLYLECTPVEAELIRRHLKETRTEEELMEIKSYIDKINNNVRTADSPHNMKEEELRNMYHKYLKENNPCMFLNGEGACSIYEVRPLRCRSFIVFSSSEECIGHDEIVTPSLPPVYISNLVMDALSTKIARFKKLSYMGKDGLEKPIKRCLVQWFKNGFEDIDRDL